MSSNDYLAQSSEASILATNKVLRNTYILLSLTLLFSAVTASVAMAMNATPMNPLIMMACYFGLLFAVSAFQNTGLGLLMVFLLTGFLGYTLGPVLTAVITNFNNGAQLVATSFGATGVIFLALSGYVMSTRSNFSYLGGFLFVGFCVAILAVIANIFMQIPMLQLILSAVIVLLASGMILYETSNIIHGGETNYIMATVSLYVALFNIFINLLHIFTALAGQRD